MVLSEETKTEIIKSLNERGAKLPCPRCGNQNFILIDGYFNQFIQPNMKDVNLGGPSIPSVMVACNKCGFLSQHALGVLSLLPKEVTLK